MRLLTPEVEEVFRWFRGTYEQGPDGRWRRVALPGAGGYGDQDSRLLEALEHVAATLNARTGRDTDG